MLDKQLENALQDGIKDMTWAMFWKGNQVANLDELEDCVKRLIRMATQKNAGQKPNATHIDWKSLDMELLLIAIEATALVLDDDFQEMKGWIEMRRKRKKEKQNGNRKENEAAD